MTKILVIGGAGFVGSNLIAHLLKNGHEVISLDNYTTGSVENHHEGCRYVNSSALWINALDDDIGGCSVVFHLGEYSRVELSHFEPDIAIQNIYSTLPSVLCYCRRNKAKLIYSASSTKFGDAKSPYMVAKYLNAELVNYYMTEYELPYAITYFYNVYGDNEISEGDYATVVAKFLRAKKNGESVEITAPGNQSRHFTHVDDIVSGLALLIENGHGDGYCIGAAAGYSIIELAQMIGVKWTIAPGRKGNRLSSGMDLAKIRAIGWRQKRFLPDYIKARCQNG